MRVPEIMEIIMWNLQSAFYAAIRRWLLLQSSRTIYQCLREILFALDASLELPLLAVTVTTFPTSKERNERVRKYSKLYFAHKTSNMANKSS